MACWFGVQVKLAYQESELASQLKKLPLGSAELSLIRDRAEKLRDGRLKTRGDALLPIILASFIFDSLCASQGMWEIPLSVSVLVIVQCTCSVYSAPKQKLQTYRHCKN